MKKLYYAKLDVCFLHEVFESDPPRALEKVARSYMREELANQSSIDVVEVRSLEEIPNEEWRTVANLWHDGEDGDITAAAYFESLKNADKRNDPALRSAYLSAKAAYLALKDVFEPTTRGDDEEE